MDQKAVRCNDPRNKPRPSSRSSARYKSRDRLKSSLPKPANKSYYGTLPDEVKLLVRDQLDKMAACLGVQGLSDTSATDICDLVFVC